MLRNALFSGTVLIGIVPIICPEMRGSLIESKLKIKAWIPDCLEVVWHQEGTTRLIYEYELPLIWKNVNCRSLVVENVYRSYEVSDWRCVCLSEWVGFFFRMLIQDGWFMDITCQYTSPAIAIFMRPHIYSGTQESFSEFPTINLIKPE